MADSRTDGIRRIALHVGDNDTVDVICECGAFIRSGDRLNLYTTLELVLLHREVCPDASEG